MYTSGPSMKKRKRGVQQRQQAAIKELQTESCLYALLMAYLAKGLLSGAKVHAIAKAAQADIDKALEGYHIKDLHRVASLSQSRNLGRTLNSIMAKEADLPAPFEVDIPLKGSNPTVPSSSIMLPHELFAAYYQHEETWCKSVLPDPAKLKPFWDKFRGHPCMTNHPVLHRPHFESSVIPVAMHGDEVPCQGIGKIWSKCVLFFSWFSIMSNAGGSGFQDAHQFIWGVFEKYIVPSSGGVIGTMEAFWAVMRWSFNIMYQGTYPDKDWRGIAYAPHSKEGRLAGSFIAGGWSACLIQVAGDLDYFAKWLQTPRWSTHERPCSLCTATYYGELSWLDNRPHSGWQQAMLTTANWRAHFSPTIDLYNLPGFSALCLALDYMHSMHLGWLQYFYGSIFHLLCFTMLPGEHLQNLATIGSFIKRFQQSNNTKHKYRMRLDKLTMFQPKKGFPRLRGRAADIAGLHQAMLALWNNYMSTDVLQHKQIKLFLQLNTKIADILETYSPTYGHTAVPADFAQQLLQAGLNMAQLHGQLSEYYQSIELQVFNLTSQTHFVLHALQLSRFIHPFLVWCYKGESTMHRVQTLWKSCLPGSKHWQASKKAAYKERHLLWIQGKI